MYKQEFPKRGKKRLEVEDILTAVTHLLDEKNYQVVGLEVGTERDVSKITLPPPFKISAEPSIRVQTFRTQNYRKDKLLTLLEKWLRNEPTVFLTITGKTRRNRKWTRKYRKLK